MTNRDKHQYPSQPSPTSLTGLWGRLVNFGFRLLYNEFAWSYDMVSWTVSLGGWRRWQLKSLQYVEGKEILEIAHGPGHMLVELSSQGYRVTGCDLSANMGKQAQRRLITAGQTAQAGLVRCFIPAFPFRSDSFDTVLSQFPTNFIFQPETLAEIYRLLRPNGRLVILPEGHLTTKGPLSRFIHWLFVITGQAAPPSQTRPAEHQAVHQEVWQPFLAQMKSAGFEAMLAKIELQQSAATVLVGIKMN